MIEKKVESEENTIVSDLCNREYDYLECSDVNWNNKNYYSYHKLHLRNIFYRFKGKHLFPDRG